MNTDQRNEISPMKAIADWLREQPTEIQTEVSSVVLSLLGERTSILQPLEECLPALLNWFAQAPNSIAEIGRALIFKALFEHIFEQRFTETGWRDAEQMFREVVAEGSIDPNSEAAQFAPGAFQMLRGLPERKELWKSVGASWTRLANSRLTDDALKTWHLNQMSPLNPTIELS